VHGICTDMYDGYVNAAKEVFAKECAIIVDRFHVAKLYRKNLVSLRKRELKRLRATLSEKKYKNLEDAIKILRRNSEFITKEELKTLNKLFRYSAKLKLAYKYCRKLTSIFNSKIGVKKAEKKINSWISEVEASNLTCYNTFIATLKKYKTEIVNYFKKRQNSGFVEGLNNKVKVIKRRCYGIFDKNKLFQRITIDLDGYDKFLKNQQLAFSCN
jgi:transposase